MDEEQLKQKEQEELRALLDALEDGEDSSVEDQKNKMGAAPADKPDGKETKPEADKEEKPNEEGSEDNANKDSKDKGKDKENKDRWNGKSREEVINEYEAMEARISALES